MASNWAIVIGINQYRFLQPLRYAKRDAEAMQDFLIREAKFDRIFLFTDDSPPINGKLTEPFRANLLRVLRQIFEKPFMKDGDNFWFFFSGHGIPHNGQDYLMPLDGDPEDIENTGISTNAITNYLRSCGADNAVMILDACRSGGKKSGEGIGRQTEAEARQTGVISLFSCSPNQYSYELEAIRHGAFTYTLLRGLGIQGRCATVERLSQYLEHEVPKLISQHLDKARQIPYTIAEPINRSHLILMPQYASPTDIATLKNDAYRAEGKHDWGLAQQLWIRVSTAASGEDFNEAIEALQRLAIQHSELLQPGSNRSNLTVARRQDRSKNAVLTWSTSFITRQQFLRWLFWGGAGVTLVTGLGAFSQQQKIRAIDLSQLDNFLRAQQWKEADQETLRIMLEVAGREEEGWLDSDSLQDFHCDILVLIDQLWAQHSDNKFGFSAQKKIWEEVGSPTEYNAQWEAFGDRVGWHKNGNWVTYDQLQFNLQNSSASLPVLWVSWLVLGLSLGGFFSLMSRLSKCNK